MTQQSRNISRRAVLSATAAAAAFTIVSPKSVIGAEANTQIEAALIGCGGRGAWISSLFKNHGGYRFVGCADYFDDKARAYGEKFGIEAGRRFSGLNGYKKLLDGKFDAVIVESPPFFHAEQAAAGVEAGKHVYCAKPMAVDVPGCMTIAESGKKATEKKKVFLIDFQTRANPLYREAVKRVHNGDMGKIVSAESVYYCGDTWGNPVYDNKDPEVRLRHWGVDKVLSGDVITEQNIHTLDVATWIIDEAPVKAVGTCGRKSRTGSGDVNDHFGVLFTFPSDVLCVFASKQYGFGMDDIGCRVFGQHGMIDTHYGGIVRVAADRQGTNFAGGQTGNIFTDGVVSNIAEFHSAITAGRYDNTTVAPSVRSNLTTILGRLACYKKGEVTWDEMMKVSEKLEFDTKSLKA